MNEINKINWSEQTKSRLSGIIGIENYFRQEINQRNSRCKKLSKYVTTFDYISKILIVLSTTSSGVCISSSASVVGAPVGIASLSCTLIFSLTRGIIKKLLSITRNKKKKYDKILMLAKSRLNSNETLVSQTLIDMEISREEFNEISREKQKYERMKENVRNVSKKQENVRLNSVNSKKTNDFVNNLSNWLKNIVKNNQKLFKIYAIKICVCVCVCIKWLILALKQGIRLEFL